MGWSNCGTDSSGRPIGYAFEATCDHPGCDAKIDRGLACACGGMHGDDAYWCDKYFCEKHMSYVDLTGKVAHYGLTQVCIGCEKLFNENHPEKEEV